MCRLLHGCPNHWEEHRPAKLQSTDPKKPVEVFLHVYKNRKIKMSLTLWWHQFCLLIKSTLSSTSAEVGNFLALAFSFCASSSVLRMRCSAFRSCRTCVFNQIKIHHHDFMLCFPLESGITTRLCYRHLVSARDSAILFLLRFMTCHHRVI